MSTPNFQLLADVLEQYPIVMTAVERLREVKPDRESRGMARGLASEAVLYGQFIRKVVLLSGTSSIRSPELHHLLTESLGVKKTALLLENLKEMKRLLDGLTTDFNNTIEKTKLLQESGPREISTRANAPKSKIQRRLDKVSAVSLDLSAMLDAPRMPLPFSDVSEPAPSLHAFFHESRKHPADAIRVLAESFGCSCPEPHVAGLRCVCSRCNPEFREPGLYPDDWKFEIAVRTQPETKSVVRSYGSSDSSPVVSAHEESSTVWVAQLSLEDSFPAPTPNGGLCSFLKAAGARADSRIRHLKNIHQSPLAFSNLDELLRYHNPPLGRSTRMVLAFRLSSAVLQAADTPWSDDAWKPKDWIVGLDAGKTDKFPVVFLNRRIDPAPSPVEPKESSTEESLGVASREPILARLGIVLAQIALGRTLPDMRRDTPGLLSEEQAKSHDSDLLDLLTARKILSLRQIAQTISPVFEDVVAACVTQQYRDKDANVKELDTRQPNFLERAATAILRPLYDEVARYLGHHQSRSPANKTPRAETKSDQHQLSQKYAEQKKWKPPSAPKRPSRQPRSDTLRPSSPAPEAPSSSNREGTGPNSVVNASRTEGAIASSEPSQDEQRVATSKPTETSSSDFKSHPGSGLHTPAAESTSDEDAGSMKIHNGDREEGGTANLDSVAPSLDGETTSGWSYGEYSESNDSAFPWIPNYTPKLPHGHPFLAFTEGALQAIFAALGMTMAAGSAHPGRPEASYLGSQAGSAYGGRKRARGNQTNDKNFGRRKQPDENDDSPEGSRPASGVGPLEDDPVPLFACPYFKKDPIAHQLCYKYRLKRIRDVKQHIGRKHSLPIYCPRCIAIFPREEERDSHIVAGGCAPTGVPMPEGTTEVQKRQLARRPPASQSEPDQWYAIFYILFDAGVARPPSPYTNIHKVLLLGAVRYEEFLEGPGCDILRDYLTNSGAVTWNAPLDDNDLESFQQNILERGLRHVFEQWDGRVALPPSPTVTRPPASETATSPRDYVPDTPMSQPEQQRPNFASPQIGAYTTQPLSVHAGPVFSSPPQAPRLSTFQVDLPFHTHTPNFDFFGPMPGPQIGPQAPNPSIEENVGTLFQYSAQDIQNGYVLDADPDAENFSWYSFSEAGQNRPPY